MPLSDLTTTAALVAAGSLAVGLLAYLHSRKRRSMAMRLHSACVEQYNKRGHAVLPLRELRAKLERLDLVLATESEVQECASLIYDQLCHEAMQLGFSPLAASFALRCIMRHKSLADILAHFLACKVMAKAFPGEFGYGFSGDVRLYQADLQVEETEMARLMKEVLSKPAVLHSVVADLTKAFISDPAAEGFVQLGMFFKGFHAVTIHRIAHDFWLRGGVVYQTKALFLQSRCSELFAVDIHPGATVGNGIMIDHATGVVIGSTAVIGNDVMMLHSVTLGATGKPTKGKRHPTIGDHVVLGAGTLVIGDVTIGPHCTLGASAVVTKDVDPGSTVVGVNEVIKKMRVQPGNESEQDSWGSAKDKVQVVSSVDRLLDRVSGISKEHGDYSYLEMMPCE